MVIGIQRRRFARLRRFIGVTGLLIAVAVPIGAMAQEASTALEAGDELQITVFGEPDFSGKYTVSTSGDLALPWAGHIAVAGMTLAALERELVGKLKTAYLADPRLTVLVAQPRPYYIMGDVKTPGRYTFQQGMTVLEAVAAAGGYRSGEVGKENGEQEVVKANETVALLLIEYRAALALQARLLAERDDAKEVALPPQMVALGRSEAITALADEVRVFASRRQALDGEIELLNQQVVSYEEDITALNGQIAAKSRQIDILNDDLKDLSSLYQRGIERKPQVTALQRDIAEAEFQRLLIISNLARAKQNLASTKLLVVDKRNGRRTEVLRALVDADSHVQRLLTQRAAAAKVAKGAAARAASDRPSLSSTEGPDDADTHVLRIQRKGGDGSRAVVAGGDTPVLPGDLIDVALVPRTEVADAPPTQ